MRISGTSAAACRPNGERALNDHCVVSPGLGVASSSSATSCRSLPNERKTSALTLLRKTTCPVWRYSDDQVRQLEVDLLQPFADDGVSFTEDLLEGGGGVVLGG